MSEKVLRDGDVLVRQEGSLRRITLNRPKTLNAITLDMAVTAGDAAHYKQRSGACYLLLEVTTSVKTKILFPILQTRAPSLGTVAR